MLINIYRAVSVKTTFTNLPSTGSNITTFNGQQELFLVQRKLGHLLMRSGSVLVHHSCYAVALDIQINIVKYYGPILKLHRLN